MPASAKVTPIDAVLANSSGAEGAQQRTNVAQDSPRRSPTAWVGQELGEAVAGVGGAVGEAVGAEEMPAVI